MEKKILQNFTETTFDEQIKSKNKNFDELLKSIRIHLINI